MFLNALELLSQENSSMVKSRDCPKRSTLFTASSNRVGTVWGQTQLKTGNLFIYT